MMTTHSNRSPDQEFRQRALFLDGLRVLARGRARPTPRDLATFILVLRFEKLLEGIFPPALPDETACEYSMRILGVPVEKNHAAVQLHIRHLTGNSVRFPSPWLHEDRDAFIRRVLGDNATKRAVEVARSRIKRKLLDLTR